jgi:pyrroloquinoline quinone biosynthesis protein B
LLLNCSPDIATQIESFSPLQVLHGRFSPICGALLTDANLDHVAGLAALRQAESTFRIRSSAVVKEVAAGQPSFAHFAAPPHRWLEVPLGEFAPNDGDDDIVGRRLTIRAIAVPGATPGYDGRRALRGAVIAYEIAAFGSNDRLLFAPVFSEIDQILADAIARAKVAFLDGSFYSDDELHATTGLSRSARAMGHQPVGGPNGTLAQLHAVRAAIVFTHINNSNPLLDPRSDASASVREFGAEIAYDGMEVTL